MEGSILQCCFRFVKGVAWMTKKNGKVNVADGTKKDFITD